MKTRSLLISDFVVLFNIFIILPAVGQGWNVNQVGQLALYWDNGIKVDVTENYAYVATCATGLRIVDISHPTTPVEVGHCFTPCSAQDVALAGDYAYVADAGGGLRIIDISNPEEPFEVGFCDTPGSACGVKVSGDYAYIADGGSGLRIIDITNPHNPFEVGFCDTPENAQDVAVSGNYAYIADDEEGLRAIDITNPFNPVETGHNDSSYARAVAVRDSIAYVAADMAGLWVVNISNPSAPVSMAYCPVCPMGVTIDIVLQGNYAYTATPWYGMHIINISNPYAPSVVGNYYPSYPHGVAVAGDYAYIVICGGEPTGFEVIGVSIPSNPVIVGGYYAEGYLYDVEISDTLAYVADLWYGLRILSIANPASPIILSGMGTGYTISGLTIAGNYAYLTFWGNEEGGLIAVDISNPLFPHLMDIIYTDYTYEVQVSGIYAYLAAYGAGLVIVDVSNPNALSIIGGCYTPGASIDVAVSGNLAGMADLWGGLRLINVVNPTNPFEIGSYQTGGSVTSVALQGNYAYIADGSLHILDISNPAAPNEIGSLTIPTSSVTVEGEYAFVCGGTNGIYVVKISNPYSPLLVGYYNTPGNAHKVAVEGDLAYVADYYNFGIYDCFRAITPILNLTLNPINPPIQIPAGGGNFQFDIAFENNSANHINFDAWIEAMTPETLNVTTFRRPNISLAAGGIISRTLTQFVPGNAPAGIYIYSAFVEVYPDTAINSEYFTFEKLSGDVASTLKKVWEIYGWTNEAEPSITISNKTIFVSASPNPFNQSSVISYQLSMGSWVNLMVYDITGREVATLVDGFKSAGSHQVVFDAKDLSSGVYFVRLEAEDFRQTQKVTLIK